MHDIRNQLAVITRQHQFAGNEDTARCAACGVTVWYRRTPHHEPGPRGYLEWYAPDVGTQNPRHVLASDGF
ncbi:hypothetical protein [Streptomyces sp. NPDC056061]|uniref:hypothetical protein n=1 Tax=Streptomyces sp. NPDC056061 TaxID=3345700 RepID=UPI0035E228D7